MKKPVKLVAPVPAAEQWDRALEVGTSLMQNKESLKETYQTVAEGVYELGKLLIGLKATVPHGSWMETLVHKLPFLGKDPTSASNMATKFMRASLVLDTPVKRQYYETVGNIFVILDLAYKQTKRPKAEVPANDRWKITTTKTRLKIAGIVKLWGSQMKVFRDFPDPLYQAMFYEEQVRNLSPIEEMLQIAKKEVTEFRSRQKHTVDHTADV